jgi:hypothetical protein
MATTLSVDRLEDRTVPAVLPLNLVSEGSSGFVGDAFFRTYDADTAGTTRLDSFVQLKPTRAGIAEGYNTDARPLSYNEANGPRATHSVLADALPLVTLDLVQYRELLLDIDQSRGLPALSLDELLVYVGDVPDPTGLVQADGTLGGMTPVYDLDAGGNTHVVMNYTLNGPRTAGDVQVYLPASLLPSGKYVTVYSRFGDTWGMDSGSLLWAPGTSPSSPAPAMALPSSDNPPQPARPSVSIAPVEDVENPTPGTSDSSPPNPAPKTSVAPIRDLSSPGSLTDSPDAEFIDHSLIG